MTSTIDTPSRAPTARQELIIEKSIDTLAGERLQVQDYSHFELTIDTDTARHLGDAISRRDLHGIITPFAETLDVISGDFADGDINEVRDSIETTFKNRLPSAPENFIEALTNPESREELDTAITQDNTRLDMTSSEYLRMLETILVAETPENISLAHDFRSNPRRYRGTSCELYARAFTALDSMATHEPGVRLLREGVMENNQGALNRFLAREAESRLACDILGSHLDSIANGTAYQKAGEMRYVLGENEPQGEIEKFEVLEWEILPDGETSQSTPSLRDRVRKEVEKTVKNGDMTDWDESRIDLLTDIASLGHERGRQPEMYISNKFKSGTGVYVAVSLTHPQDPTKRIVVADNPLSKNALYFVDELRTSINPDTDLRYEWRDVMVSNKQEARHRGATRRYHVGKWEGYALRICDYQGLPLAEDTPQDPIITPVDEFAAHQPSRETEIIPKSEKDLLKTPESQIRTTGYAAVLATIRANEEAIQAATAQLNALRKR